LVIGSSNMDLVVSVPHMPAIGETIMSSSKEEIPGGKGANQAYTCAKLGANITFLTAVGEDSFGKAICDNLRQVGIDVEQFTTSRDASTGMAFIYVDAEGDNSIVVVQGANTQCDSSYLSSKKDIILSHDILLTQLEIPNDGVYDALKLAKKAGITTVLNPAPAPKFIPNEVLKAVDFITPNETELAFLTGMKVVSEKDAVQASERLLEKGVKNVIATLGSKGAVLSNEKGYTSFGVPQVKAVDTTAAGDVFNGAFVTALGKNKCVKDSIRFATAAATAAVTRKGAQSSTPTHQEVLKYLAIMPSEKCFPRFSQTDC